jgi:hypothetical protein
MRQREKERNKEEDEVGGEKPQLNHFKSFLL